MSLKSLIEKMDQISALNEATKETPTGRIHKAEPGGYGRKDDEDSEGKKVEPAVKRGRGRPKKGADSSTGELKKYDFAKDLQSFMVGNLPGGKAPGKKGQVHKIKDESKQDVADGASKQELENSAGTMTLEQFVDVYGEENKHIWHEVNKKQDVSEAKKKMKGEDPCWDTHQMVGTKKGKGGKPVPNCVPKESVAEGTKETPTGRVHKAEPGGYGRKDDEDSEGKKAKPQVKRGRGRPKKGADSETGQEKKWDTDKLASWIVGNKPKTLPGKASVKHKLKDWMEHVESKMLVESIVDEGRMGEVHMILQDIVNGNLDLYDVMNHPRDPEQEYASKILQRKYETVAGENGLHPDDDFEEIQSIMMDELEDEYGTGLSEVALDPSQVAAPQIKAPGSAGTQPTQGTTQQPTQPGQQTTSQPQAGAAIIDFKNPQDPLKSAIQQAVKNKQVTIMATESKQINEGMASKLDDILQNYPHEHKVAQEGWGIHEALYQALCDHYWNEGRIPREKMYGPSQELRDWVEECYMTDTQPVMGEGLAGAALGGVAGAVVGKTPAAASLGANLGSEIQDTLTTEGDREDAEMQIKTPAFLRKERGAAPLSLSQVGTKDRYGVGGKTYSIGDEPLARGTAAVSGQQVDTLPESELEASLRGSVQDMEENYMSESKLNKQGVAEGASLQELENSAYTMTLDQFVGVYGEENAHIWYKVNKEQGVAEGEVEESGLQAYLGNKKYGKEGMDALRKAGREGASKEKMAQIRDKHDKLDEVAPEGWEGTVKAMKKHKDIDNPWALAHWMKGKGMKSHKKEGAGDAQMEAWSKQLNTLLTEGLTITTSTGNEHTPDSVSVNATDADAHELMKLVQAAGLGQRQSQSMSSPAQDVEVSTVEPVSQDEVMGTLEPADDGGEAMGFLKRMLGARQEHGDHGAEDHGGDYEEESGACSECGHEECECDHEEVSEMGNEAASSGDSKMSPVADTDIAALQKLAGTVPKREEPVAETDMEEGNLFTGNLAKARAAGKKEADLDGDGDMEKVREELKGGQKNLDVAEPKGKLTGADFAKLRGEKKDESAYESVEDQEKEEVEESALDQPATMESEKTCNECGMYESDCGGTHGEEKLDEWANSPNDSDEQFLTDIAFMTKSISGGLNGMKQDQTVLPSTRVKTEGERVRGDLSLAELMRKLSNIN